MIINRNSSNTTTTFGKFIKINGRTKKLESFRCQLKNKTDKEFLTQLTPKSNNNGVLYIFSGKIMDKIIDILQQGVCLVDFHNNPEKFLNKKAKAMKISDAHKKLKKEKLL